jgi:hypothetical protein
MGLKIKATKVYKNLPCGHAQWFDTKDDGTPGHCAQVHDHVTVLPADDPRIGDIPDVMVNDGGLLGTLRVLPSGVSMEMSSVFIWEHVNHYIYKITDGRCYVERVRVYEHERNDAMCEVDEDTAKRNAEHKIDDMRRLLVKQPRWTWESPKDLMKRING